MFWTILEHIDAETRNDLVVFFKHKLWIALQYGTFRKYEPIVKPENYWILWFEHAHKQQTIVA